MDDKLYQNEQNPVDGTEATGQTPQSDESGLTVEEYQSRLDMEHARADEYYGRLLRLQADFENYRRRTQKEKEELWKYASEQLIISLLPVLDNLERALLARDDDPVRVVEGVEMIYRQLQDVLTREGLCSIPAVGEEFDPSCHEAMLQQETDQHPDNTVLEELQKGYLLKDKVIRPTMVKVARKV